MVEREYEGKRPERGASAAAPTAPLHLMVQVRSRIAAHCTNSVRVCSSLLHVPSSWKQPGTRTSRLRSPLLTKVMRACGLLWWALLLTMALPVLEIEPRNKLINKYVPVLEAMRAQGRCGNGT